MARSVWYDEYPIATLTAIAGRSEQTSSNSVMIPPDGKAEAGLPSPDVRFPLRPVARDHWAQLGLHAVWHNGERGQNETFRINLFNWSRTHALLVTTEDVVALATVDRIKQRPVLQSIPLTATGMVLQVLRYRLPRYRTMPYAGAAVFGAWDAHAQWMPNDIIRLDPQDFAVIRTSEVVEIGERQIGLLACSIPGLMQGSSALVRPGFRGPLVMQIKSFASGSVRIRRGTRIGTLSVYAL